MPRPITAAPITAEQLDNIVKLLQAQGPMPMLCWPDWQHIIACLREHEERAVKAITWKVTPSGVKEMWVGRLLLGWMFFSHLTKCWPGRHIDGKLTDYASEADAKAAIEAVVLDA